MTALIHAMRQHHTASRQELTIPELDNTVIHFTPLTVGERLALDENASPLQLMAEVVIRKSEDENGKRLFTDGDLPILIEQTDSEIVSKIASAIMGVSEVDAEVEKSEQTPD